MDEIDSKILRRLLTDARSSYRKIAFELGISPPTVDLIEYQNSKEMR